MTTDISQHLPNLPGAVRFINRATHDVSQGKSVVILTPATIDAESLVSACLVALRRMDMWVEEIDISQRIRDESPFRLLRRAFFTDVAEQDRYTTVADLLRADGMPQATLLNGFERLTKSERSLWLYFLARWAETAHSAAMDLGQPPCALLMCLTPAPDDVLPDDNPRLTILWWWSVLSALDMQLACRFTQDLESGLLDDAMAWREALLPGITGSDLALMDWLWDDILLDFSVICARLRSYALQHGWQSLRGEARRKVLSPSEFFPNQGSTRPSTADQRTLWAAGLLDQVAEFGPAFSSAWLSLDDAQETLRHRMWQDGQAVLLLPMINEARLIICQTLTRRYGPTWVYAWNPPATADDALRLPDDSLATEWGQLEWALARAPHGEQHWAPLVRHGRFVRNQLAHYRLIRYGDYVRLRQLMPRP